MRPDRRSLRPLRYLVQLAFLGLTLHAGYRFLVFVRFFEVPGADFAPRPDMVDGFLPIAGLMSLKYFLFTGIVEPFHPAAFFIFVAALAVSLAAKKGFCGWVCPVGTVSQYAWMLGEKVLGRNLRVEKYTDIGLRMIKYSLMTLFLLLIGFAMAPNMMVLFFLSDYYKVADVKTMKFFTEMSTTAFWSLLVITGGSLLYKNVWCRYLCPYGALLGLLSRLSPLKIRRNEEKCTGCRACTRHCPALITVHSERLVRSAECFGCLTCLSRCPEAGAIDLTVPSRPSRKTLHPLVLPVVLIAVFYLVIGSGMLLGRWKSDIPLEEYRRLIPQAGMLHH
ncbi:MAG: 4Fe-4S binding protein [Thermodesulfovibrionales bacterium]